MELEIVRADPAGNITVFVLTALTNPAERVAAVRTLMADPVLKAEQVGFVIPAAADRLWRLEMMGGEFCGNAARSFGLLIAGQTGLSGRHTLMIEISGAARPLPVRVDTIAKTAEVAMPGPLGEASVEHAGRRFPAYVFEGITHVIAEDMEPHEGLIPALLDRLSEGNHPGAWRHPAALGVMFYDTRKRFMRPVVWVRASGTTVTESSCGSGSAALGVWMARDTANADACFDLAQPGGSITVRIEKQHNVVHHIFIGGKVTLDEPQRRFMETP
jgi:diaminopimelate epimerase